MARTAAQHESVDRVERPGMRTMRAPPRISALVRRQFVEEDGPPPRFNFAEFALQWPRTVRMRARCLRLFRLPPQVGPASSAAVDALTLVYHLVVAQHQWKPMSSDPKSALLSLGAPASSESRLHATIHVNSGSSNSRAARRCEGRQHIFESCPRVISSSGVELFDAVEAASHLSGGCDRRCDRGNRK